MLLAVLIFIGLGLVGLSIFDFYDRKHFPVPTALWGSLFLGLAAVWIYWDAKTRTLTADEETERLLLKCVKRARKLGRIEAVVEEFRAEGASKGTLQTLASAPSLLKKRARAKIDIGAGLFFGGIGFTCIGYYLAGKLGMSHFVATLGAVGAGAGMLISGLLQLRLLRKTKAIVRDLDRPCSSG